MVPTLPQDDPASTERARRLEKRREQYRFAYGNQGIVTVEKLPLREKDDLGYYAAAALVMGKLKVNELARGNTGDETGIDKYEALYATIDTPGIVSCWDRDDIFAWQAVAGTNPVMLQAFTERMDHFPVTDGHVRSALGIGLDQAIAERRLYLSDYRMLDGLPSGTVDGHSKVNLAPLALYGVGAQGLVPVAIQCSQTPGADAPIFTPADGVSWKMARTAVASGDGNVQGIVSHFALCHQVMESVIVAARRQLSERHPLLVMLAPHFQNTMLANDIAMKSLVSADGYMERLQSPTLDASLALATRQIDAFRITASAPGEDAARRGIDDLDALPDYPFRDDALLLWEPVHAWVDGYIRLYYAGPADVAADTELAAWVAEMGADDGGRLAGLDKPETVEAVVELVARIVFRCTVHHASINYASFPLFSYPPNVPTAAFAPAPTGGSGDTEAAWEAMLPPFALAGEGFTLFYEITTRLNELGKYPRRHFADPRVGPVLEAYQQALAEAEDTIAQRNSSRRLAYPYMLPSQVSLSIHV